MSNKQLLNIKRNLLNNAHVESSVSPFFYIYNYAISNIQEAAMWCLNTRWLN